MTATFAIVPVKDPARGKSRLAPCLADGERAALNVRLAARTFDCCSEVLGPARVLVVTASDAMAAEAARRGMPVARERSPGDLNAALRLGAEAAIGLGARAIVVVPADIARISASALRRAVAALESADGGIVVADRHGSGTNLLGLHPARTDLFRFGAESFGEHAAAALDAGVDLRALDCPDLALDLDLPEDYALWRREAPAG